MLKGHFETVYFAEQVGHIQMRTRLLSRFINQLAVLPVNLVTKQSFDPIEDGVFDVFAQSQLVLVDDVAVVIVAADSFCNHQFVAILVVGKHEEV